MEKFGLRSKDANKIWVFRICPECVTTSNKTCIAHFAENFRA
ncbi:hypothetical protein SL1157_0014 [Ruegeria lacuscaerulensis ITI-1157]|nr:hypothetical protein SL1157_0014 [Ruegeria lacuscaerulensis ITI-1157]